MEIIVNYEEASKNGDMPALTCFKPKNKYAFVMVVSAVSNEANEIFKIVSEQGYLKKHDSNLLDKVAEKFVAWDSKVKGTREDGVCFFTIENILKGIEDLKAEVADNDSSTVNP